MLDTATLHSHTPALSVVDPRGAPVRSVAYARAQAAEPTMARILRQVLDEAGRVVALQDPRHLASAPAANEHRVYTLQGTVLGSIHMDAGSRRTLPAPDESVRWLWSAIGDVHRVEIDSSGRQVAIFVQRPGKAERCSERRVYGGTGASSNRARGRLLCHDDDAGRLDAMAYDLNGSMARQRRRYLGNLDAPDWPSSDADLEAIAYETHWSTDATGRAIGIVDARGHRRTFAYDRAGQPATAILEPVGGMAAVLIDAIDYDAHGQACREVCGNGVVMQARYDSAHGRLVALRRSRPDRVLQDLAYAYDPVGNVVEVVDRALPTEWFAGEQVEPVDRYRYDSLSQLIEATGRESLAANGGPDLPELALPGDGSRWRNYLESYDYDAAGNLLRRRHVASGGSYTQQMIVDGASNRAVRDEGVPVDIDAVFDPAGRQRFLQRGQGMTWDAQGRLLAVVLVVRSEGDDEERYAYDAGGERVRKQRRWWANGTMHREDVRYLPGLELRDDTEIVRVSAGRCGCRVVRSPSGRQTRYEIDDRLHSVALELDERGRIASYEGYLPYGGSAWRAGRQLVEVGDRSRRHAGRERDATGLYDYGHRFYAPWLCRWMSPDPAGDVDGPNRYRFARGNPTSLRDIAGLFVDVADYDPIERTMLAEVGGSNLSRGLSASDGALSSRDRLTMGEGLHLAVDLTGRAATNLAGNGLPEVDATLSRIFAVDGSTHAGAAQLGTLRNYFADQLTLVRNNLVGRLAPGNDRLAWLDLPPNDTFVAAVSVADPLQRIFFNRRFVGTSDRTALAFHLVHEQSHATLDTHDVVYVSRTENDYRAAAQVDVASVVSRYARGVTLLGNYVSPSSARRTMSSPGEQQIMDSVPAFAALPPPIQRNTMLSRNADTFSTVAVMAGADMVAHWDRNRPRLPRRL